MKDVKKHRINRQISGVSKVRLVTDSGNQEVSIATALKMAEDAKLDLVEVHPDSELPVCKIMDYGKFLYQEQKKVHHHKAPELKELRLSSGIGEHDYQVRFRQATEFLEAGHKIKVSLKFKGREITHANLGRELFDRFVKELGPLAQVDQRSKLEGKHLIMILAPRKGAHHAAQERQKEAGKEGASPIS